MGSASSITARPGSMMLRLYMHFESSEVSGSKLGVTAKNKNELVRERMNALR